MAFDPKKDYTAAIAKETDPAKKAALEAEKKEKVASMQSSGLDYTKAQDVQKYNQQYAGTSGKYEFNMNAPVPGATTGLVGGFTPPPVTDMSAQIKAMYEPLIAAQNASTAAAGAQAERDYQSQIEQTPGQFAPLKDQVDVNTIRNIQRMNETAAAKGTAFTGGVQSSQGGTYSAGEGQKTALSAQEANVVASLKKAIADVKSATSMKQIENTAQVNAQMNQALLAESDRIYNAQYQGARDQYTSGLDVAGLTGYYGGQRTLAGQSQDFTKQQADVQNKQWQQQFQQSQKEFASNEAWKQKTFDYQANRDKVQDGQWLKQFEQQKADAQASRAISWGNLKLNRDQFEWSRNPNNPNNVMKAAEAESAQFQNMFKQSLDMMGQTTRKYDPSTGEVIEVPMFSQEQIANFIDNSNLSDAEAYRLRKSLSIPDNFKK